MTDILARDWKALLLCFLLAVLVWFLVNERGFHTATAPLLEPAAALAPTLDPP